MVVEGLIVATSAVLKSLFLSKRLYKGIKMRLEFIGKERM